MCAKKDGLQIRYFTDEQVNKIHANALELLENHGFVVEHKQALELLADSGAGVDFEKQVVKVKPDLAQKCMSTTISSFVLGARDASKDGVNTGSPTSWGSTGYYEFGFGDNTTGSGTASDAQYSWARLESGVHIYDNYPFPEGDYTQNGVVDLADIAWVSQYWDVFFDVSDLAKIAEYWLSGL